MAEVTRETRELVVVTFGGVPLDKALPSEIAWVESGDPVSGGPAFVRMAELVQRLHDERAPTVLPGPIVESLERLKEATRAPGTAYEKARERVAVPTTNAELRESAATRLARSPAFEALPRHERVSCYDEMAEWAESLLAQRPAPSAQPWTRDEIAKGLREACSHVLSRDAFPMMADYVLKLFGPTAPVASAQGGEPVNEHAYWQEAAAHWQRITEDAVRNLRRWQEACAKSRDERDGLKRDLAAERAAHEATKRARDRLARDGQGAIDNLLEQSNRLSALENEARDRALIAEKRAAELEREVDRLRAEFSCVDGAPGKLVEAESRIAELELERERLKQETAKWQAVTADQINTARSECDALQQKLDALREACAFQGGESLALDSERMRAREGNPLSAVRLAREERIQSALAQESAKTVETPRHNSFGDSHTDYFAQQEMLADQAAHKASTPAPASGLTDPDQTGSGAGAGISIETLRCMVSEAFDQLMTTLASAGTVDAASEKQVVELYEAVSALRPPKSAEVARG